MHPAGFPAIYGALSRWGATPQRTSTVKFAGGGFGENIPLTTTGANRCVVVSIQMTGATAFLGTPSFGGAAFTTLHLSAGQYVGILVDAPLGTHNVSWTPANGCDYAMVATAYRNVEAFTGAVVDTTSTMTPSVSVAVQQGDAVVACDLRIDGGIQQATIGERMRHAGFAISGQASATILDQTAIAPSTSLNIQRVGAGFLWDRTLVAVALRGGARIPALFDAASSGAAGASSVTVSHIVANEANRVLYAFVTQSNDSFDVETVTYGGAALTKLGTTVTQSQSRLSVWRLLNPPAGTANLVASMEFGTNAQLRLVGVSYFNVDQTTPNDTLVTATGGAALTAPIGTDRRFVAAFSVFDADGPLTMTFGGLGPRQSVRASASDTFGVTGLVVSDQTAFEGATSEFTYSATAEGRSLIGFTLNGALETPPVVNQDLEPTSVDDSVDVIGAPVVSTGAVTLSASAVDDAVDAFGAASVSAALTLTSSSIDDSVDTIGTPSLVPGAVSLSASSVSDADVIGAPTVAVGAVTLSLAAVNDALDAFGFPSVTPGLVSLTATGVDDLTDSFGTPAVSTGAVTLTATGVDDSTDPFGTPSVSTGPVTLVATGIDDATDSVGSPDVVPVAPGSVTLIAAGVQGTSSFGSPAVSTGAVTLSQTAVADSTDAIGTPVVSAGPVALTTEGLQGAVVFGQPGISLGLRASGFTNTPQVGAPTTVPGAVNLGLTGVEDADQVGTPVLSIDQELVLQGVSVPVIFGAPSVAPGTRTIQPAGFSDPDSFGAGVLTVGPTTVQATGVVSSSTIGLKRVSLVDKRSTKRTVLVLAENRAVAPLAESRTVLPEGASRVVTSPRRAN